MWCDEYLNVIFSTEAYEYSLGYGAKTFKTLNRPHGLRLRGGRLRIRRRRVGVPARGEGLLGRRARDGQALDRRRFPEDHVVAAALDLAPGPEAARLLQHAAVPARDDPVRQQIG